MLCCGVSGFVLLRPQACFLGGYNVCTSKGYGVFTQGRFGLTILYPQFNGFSSFMVIFLVPSALGM